jgi:hypothetical protein
MTRKSKRILAELALAIALFVGFPMVSSAQELTVSFTTTNIANGEYSPRHIVAVWVKRENGQYVKTLLVYAAELKNYLTKWNGNSGGDRTDAVSGATLPTHRSHTVKWNMKNFLGQTVSDGSYKLCMEITSNDAAGPYREIPFTLNGSNFSLVPENASNFSNIKLDFNNGKTGFYPEKENEFKVTVLSNGSAGQLRAEVESAIGSEVTFTLYSINMQFLGSTKKQLKVGANMVELDRLVNGLAPGNYIVIASSKEQSTSHKITIK